MPQYCTHVFFIGLFPQRTFTRRSSSGCIAEWHSGLMDLETRSTPGGYPAVSSPGSRSTGCKARVADIKTVMKEFSLMSVSKISKLWSE